MINDKMKHFIKVSREYLAFLRNDEKKDSRGMARAFLFENLLKSLILIVDDMLTQFEKNCVKRVNQAAKRNTVRNTSTFNFMHVD